MDMQKIDKVTAVPISLDLRQHGLFETPETPHQNGSTVIGTAIMIIGLPLLVGYILVKLLARDMKRVSRIATICGEEYLAAKRAH